MRHGRSAEEIRPYLRRIIDDEGRGVGDDSGSWMRVACREALTGSAHQMNRRERCGQRHEETTMATYLPHDEYTPREPAGGRP
jgi:hypothetical protein